MKKRVKWDDQRYCSVCDEQIGYGVEVVETFLFAGPGGTGVHIYRHAELRPCIEQMGRDIAELRAALEEKVNV